jgi:predicted AAA+ superfamily ATPase
MDRNIESLLIKRLKEERAVALLGPRQAGKSFLLKLAINKIGGTYLSLDDPLLREEIAKDPLGFLRSQRKANAPLFIDEAAKVASVFDAVKVLIDEQGRNPSGICLANSGNYLLMKRVKESLAGRVNLLSLFPLSWREFCPSANQSGLLQILAGLPPVANQASLVEIKRTRNERLLWGGFPIPALADDPDARIRWANDYLKTYVFPILIDQFNIRAIEAFEKCARLLFAQSSEFLNYSRLAQETGISQPTANSYAHQLKAMMLIVTLEPYLKNLKKRLLKQPKIHVLDPLLLHHSFGTNFNLQATRERGLFGKLYESFIVSEIIKTLENNGSLYRAYSWRTADKAEVDLIIEAQGKTLPFEIKSSEILSSRDVSGLNSFLDDNPDCQAGYIIYPGEKIIPISGRIIALPDWLLLGAY